MTPAWLIASGLGLGLTPIAPGTVASAAAALLGWGMLTSSVYALPIGVVLAAFGGLWAAQRIDAANDPGWVVIDEIAGQWIALLGLSRVTPLGVLVAFLVFRLLDIVKPGPVGWADRQHNAAGLMADDLVAGAITAGIVWAAQSYWPIW